MKLLPVKELNTKISDQRKADIDSGLFLAKKIDRLREDAAEAQKEHDDTLASLKAEEQKFVTEHSSRKGRLEKEIEALIEQKRILSIPLDTEWNKVRAQSEGNEEVRVQLAALGLKLKISEENIAEKLVELSKRECDLKTLEELAKSREEKALKNESESTRNLEISRNLKEDTERQAKEATVILQKRKNDVSYRELDVDNRLKIAIEKEKDNEKESKRIESKQRQLSAAFAELKNKHNASGTQPSIDIE